MTKNTCPPFGMKSKPITLLAVGLFWAGFAQSQESANALVVMPQVALEELLTVSDRQYTQITQLVMEVQLRERNIPSKFSQLTLRKQS
jgi:hypothetical protein